MIKFYAGLIICVLYANVLFAQGGKKNTLSVPKYPEIQVNDLLVKLSTARADTGKVWLLYKVAAVYWWRRSAKYNDLDSAIVYAAQARALSRNIKFTEGFDEASFLLCKSYAEEDKVELAEKWINDVQPEQQVRMLLVIGEHYMSRAGTLLADVKKSYPYLVRALKISRAIASQHWTEESQIALAKYYFAGDDTAKGVVVWMQVINHYQQTGDKASEAHWWSDLGRYSPLVNLSIVNNVKYLENALRLYTEIGDKENMAYAMNDIAMTIIDPQDGEHQDVVRAIKLVHQAITIFKAVNHKKLYSYYFNLAYLYRQQSNLKQALFYAIASLNNMDMLKDEQKKGLVLNELGLIYRDLGRTAESIKYLMLANEKLTHTGRYIFYYNVKDITDVLLQQGKSRAAQQYLQRIEKNYPPATYVDKETFLAAKGNCYQALGRIGEAEKYYLKMIATDDSLIYENSVQYSKGIAGPEAYFIIAKFYTGQKRYARAVPYLNHFNKLKFVIPLWQMNAALMQSKVDSAAGNYTSALKNYEKYTVLKDSIYKVTNARQMADMEVGYETRQKETEIKLLQKGSQLQLRQISQAQQSRNFTYAGIVMLGIIIGIGYNRYRLKQSSYWQLEQKQTEINQQNGALQTLALKQAKLLEEKEWLVKEIHHRVKNNLQLMHNLLTSQQHYLENDSAAMAIRTSQHRMQAMALVHQKLYLTDQMNQIQMDMYIHELLAYLKSSFDMDSRVRFDTRIDKLMLDVVQAIPLGLIINEAVTNALKYAFPDNRRGKIDIVLQPYANELMLKITDDGIGLPDDFDTDANASFGMKLINGLGQQLDGDVTIKSHNGLQIAILFKPFVPAPLS